MLRHFVSSLALCLALTPLCAQEAAKSGRIVSLGGSVTETIVELGQLDKLVAIDVSSIYPPEQLGKLPKVGYYRQIGAEGVLAMQPTMVITTSEAGPKEALEQVKAAGVPVHVIEESKSLEGVREKIEEIADLLDVTDAMEEAALAKFDAALAAAKADLEKAQTAGATKPKVLFVMNSDGTGALSVAGKGTGIDEMIKAAGGVNAAGELNQYQPMSIESVIAAAPDIVLAPTGHGPMANALEGIKKSPALSGTPAQKKGAVYGVDLTLTAGFGPRAPEGLHHLIKLFYGDLSSSQ